MQRTLPTFAMPFDLSKKTASTQRSLNDRIAAFNAERDAHAERTNQLNGRPLAAGEAGAFSEAARSAFEEKLNLLFKERALRQDIAVFYADCEADRSKARDRAHHAHEVAKADVLQKLLDIGYLEGFLPGTNVPSVQPGYIMTHPKVVEARNYYATVRDLNLHPNRTVNDNALGMIDKEITRARERLLQTNLS